MNIKIFPPLLTLCLLAVSTQSFAADTPKMEKCSGIVKAGKADGQSVVDGKKVDWILMPAGQCMKFVGGKVIFDKK